MKSYIKEVKCPVTLYGSVIGHNLMRLTYENEKKVKTEFYTYIPKSKNHTK